MKEFNLPFDRKLKIDEVFSERELENIRSAIAQVLGEEANIIGPESPQQPGLTRQAVLWELEPICFIETSCKDPERCKGAARVFTILMKEAIRYRMASDIHIQTVNADYEALQEKHAALQVSEKKFRALSEQLEERVQKQVKTIEAAQAKIFQTEKLASTASLAAGMAHELNTPLTYIQSNLNTAKLYLDDIAAFCKGTRQHPEKTAIEEDWDEFDVEFILEDCPKLFSDSLEGVEKAAAIIKDLKIFSNINQQHFHPDNLNNRLLAAIHILEPQFTDKVSFVFQGGDIPEIYCYPGHLGQLFYNLLLNGAQAIEDQGTVEVTTELLGEEIKISIKDSGTGIKNDDLSHIFDPFFTTREVGSGKGLGLTVANDILKAHRGRIEVESNTGSGSLFTVFLPTDLEKHIEDHDQASSE